MAIAGGCLCGAVRFTIEAEAPLGVRQCWCRVCQYIGAGSGTVNAIFPKAAVSASGPLVEYVCEADSGSIMHRWFCGKCGTPLFSEAEPRPHQIVVRVGTLDDLAAKGTSRQTRNRNLAVGNVVVDPAQVQPLAFLVPDRLANHARAPKFGQQPLLRDRASAVARIACGQTPATAPRIISEAIR